MTHVLSPDRVVFEGDPEAAAALLLHPGEYRPPTRPLFDLPWYPTRPATWRPPAHYFRPAAERLGVMNGDGLAFAHQRQAPSGVTRLVVVTVGCTAFGPEGYTVALLGRPFTPANRSLGSRVWAPRSGNPEGTVGIPLKGTHRLRLLAGQPDAADPAHFTIGYELDGTPGTIDGWLRPAGKLAGRTEPLDTESIKLTIRDGPVINLMNEDLKDRWIRERRRQEGGPRLSARNQDGSNYGE